MTPERKIIYVTNRKKWDTIIKVGLNMKIESIEQGLIQIKKIPGKERHVEILFIGDLCPRGKMEELILAGKSKEILAELKPVLEDCDLSVTNLETPLTRFDTPILKSGPNLKVVPECVELLKEADFDVALLANNHIGDYGTKPVLDTMRMLERNGIAFAGAGKDLEDARKPLCIRGKGLRIAFLNYAENEFGGADRKKPGASTLDPVVNIGEILECSRKNDLTIVVVHGGNEGNPIPSPRMKKTYRAFAVAGASAVIGIHTHCPQGLEIWNGVPIIYSLGDFFFECPWGGLDATNFWWTGYSVKIRFDAESAASVEIIPHTFAPDGARVRIFDTESKKQFLRYLSNISEILADEKQSTRYWESWCAKIGPALMRQFHIPKLPLSILKTEMEKRNALSVRNLFTCEAHNEVLNTYLRLMEENRIEEALRFYPKIEKLQKADFRILKKSEMDRNKK